MARREHFELTRQLKLFVLACCVSLPLLSVDQVRAERLANDISYVASSRWQQSQLSEDTQAILKKWFFHRQVTTLKLAGECGVLLMYEKSCGEDMPWSFDAADLGHASMGKDCAEAAQSNDCIDEVVGIATDMHSKRIVPRTGHYGIRESEVLGFINNKYRRFSARTESISSKKSRYVDAFIAKTNLGKDAGAVGTVDVIMLCDEDGYKQEKANFEKFIMSLKFRGKPLVPRSEKWLPHEDVYCDACPPEKSKQKPTVR